jgi:D-alanyl-lipoteichoic acid acyltransferase DltB (MBOAT superfamily)
MSFVSYSFGLLFLAIFFVRMALDPVRHKGAYLAAVIVASFVFYAWLVPAYVLVLLTTSGVDYLAAARMPALAPGSGGRKALLVVSLAVNLGMLAFFKYFDFAAGNVVALLQTFGLRLSPPHLELALPLGISFYTFESMSYTIDVYRDRIQPVRRLRDYVLFIGFFPHLVAGPIVRARDFLYQIERTRRPRLRVVTYGAYLMIRGFFLKLVVADNLATIVDAHWPRAGAENANASLTLAIAVMFGLQILCDFDGYTSIARGGAYILGFRLPVNFRAPYLAGTFRSFWQRWHITLSRWLRDYLYVPLGGNRGSRLRTYANLLTVMLLGGLWHGGELHLPRVGRAARLRARGRASARSGRPADETAGGPHRVALGGAGRGPGRLDILPLGERRRRARHPAQARRGPVPSDRAAAPPADEPVRASADRRARHRMGAGAVRRSRSLPRRPRTSRRDDALRHLRRVRTKQCVHLLPVLTRRCARS